MNGNRKILILTILAVMVMVLAGIGSYYWYENVNYVKTEDAKITGDLVTVGPQITGKLLELKFEEGDMVLKDQVLGRQESTTLADINFDQSILRAPISGIVIKKQGTVGELVSPGQTVAILIDPDKLYITANIEETKLGRVRQGQKVEFTVDQFSGENFVGEVKFVGQAANSAFALIPSSTSGTFTKVVQKIPVKIIFDSKGEKFLPGTNAVVKIHIK